MNASGVSRQLAPWVLVCGGFHRLGGMDRANLSLAETLLAQGRTVYLVGHHIDSELASRPKVNPVIVPRPLGSILLGEGALRREGIKTAQAVNRHFPGARILVNGGNCEWPNINWVHSVHHAWPRVDEGSPLWFRAKSALNKWKAMRDEKRSLLGAKLVIANSERTRHDLISLGVSSEKIRTVYLGSDAEWAPSSLEQKLHARRSFSIPADEFVVCFVGALGYDRNKGFDTLLRAWKQVRLPNACLLAAGGGRGLDHWHKQVRESGLANHIRLLGFTEKAADVYAASDILVSPVRYEAYGLNVHEAICRGIPSIVSATAGVAELYPPEVRRFLLRDPEDASEVGYVLNHTLENLDSARKEFSSFGNRLRSRTWEHMSREIISCAEEPAFAPHSRG